MKTSAEIKCAWIFTAGLACIAYVVWIMVRSDTINALIAIMAVLAVVASVLSLAGIILSILTLIKLHEKDHHEICKD